MRFGLPIPKTEDDFEHLCCELLKRHWDRPLLQRYAHRGEDQEGIDIFDPSQTRPIRGGQCKLHGYGKTIPPKEIEDEVEKAKQHTPALDHFTILTTGKKSKQADRKVAEINRDHQARGLFTVEVLTWDQIENLLDQHSEVRDPIYFPLAHQRATQIESQLAAIMLRVEAPGGGAGDVIDGELDGIKVELERHKLELAWQLCERLQTRQGDRLSERQRWRLLTFQGNVRLGQGRLEEAGSLLIQAKQHQPSDEKALVNEAVGYELAGDTAKAHELAVQLRQAYPRNEDVVALWVRTAEAGVTAGQLEAEAGALAASSTNVALALSICLLNRGDLEGAERHARRATVNEPHAPQGWLMLGQAVHMRGFRSPRAEDRERLLGEALGHYQRAEELARNQGTVHLQAGAVLNRAVVRALLGDPTAGEDFLAARALAPRDPGITRRYAVYLSDLNQLDRAVDEARAAFTLEQSGETMTLLAAVLWDRDRGDDRREALDLCLQALRTPASGRFEEALEMAVSGLLGAGRADEVVPLLDGLPAGRLSSVARNAFLAQLHLAGGDNAAAEEHARRGAAEVTEATGVHDLRRLARVLVRLGLHAAAFPLLQRTANPTHFDPDTRMLLDCANRLGRHQTVMELLRALREAGVPDRRLLDNEIDLLQQYDRGAAIGVLQAHLARHPDDHLARLRLSGLALKSERYDLIDADPNHMPAAEDAPPSTVGRLAVGILERSGRWADALDYAYRLLRRNFGDADSHFLYCVLLLHAEHDGHLLEASEAVQPGMAVAYREQGESAVRWVVVENSEPQAQLEEYAATHPRVQRMLGLRVGDSFTLSSAGVQDRSAEIVEIVSKYVFRFQDSMAQYQARFPERHDLQQVRLLREGGSEDELDLSPILASLDERRRHVLHVRSIYAAQPTPIHLFAEAAGRHLFEAMQHLTTSPDAGVRWCCQGSPDEREAALRAARENKDVVLDLTTLFAVWRLDLMELLRRWTGRRFFITQSTFDKVRAIVETETAPGPRRHMSASGQGGFDLLEVPEEQRAEYVRSMQSLLTFVRERCTVLPIPEVASVEPERREELVELIGRDGLEGVLAAARAGFLLWTDDGTLGMIARGDFQTDRRVWTQLLLHVAADENALTQEEFNRHSARLIGLGYSFTWCSPAIVQQAGELTQWNCEAWPLRRVIRHFGLQEIHPQMKLEMAAHSIAAMFRSEDSPFKREVFVRAILNQLGSRRLAQLLAAMLWQLFGVDVLRAHEAVETIRTWARGGLILP
jgi:tetratricopeptide (TPR) repeat protein